MLFQFFDGIHDTYLSPSLRARGFRAGPDALSSSLHAPGREPIKGIGVIPSSVTPSRSWRSRRLWSCCVKSRWPRRFGRGLVA
ncbi:hypothetical protein NK6_1637 [Bradyrhizobium diazoefficiens]|uniref:Uncharacterized protein n=1 Tax=Bradyrhizobium diazoefficiens TaxID=1355477 RepID=A0A0E4BKZ3_9BRAD|nr:hypothetical protein NK6_1637 [Bradyrhizobium diazoefficiens]